MHPAQLGFGIERITVDGAEVRVSASDRARLPFCTLTEFSCEMAQPEEPTVLIVAPLSGHFPVLLRELVLGLVRRHRVVVTNWINAAHVPLSAGHFGFTHNIETLMTALDLAGGPVVMIAACQGVVPSLAAVALASQTGRCAPSGLVLIGGPVDPLANPTRVVQLLRDRPLAWFERTLIEAVPANLPGAGRRVYPAATQLRALEAYRLRHYWQGGELLAKTLADDGSDADRFPFLGLYRSLMDLPADYFLENIKAVFHDRALVRGRLSVGTVTVDCAAIRKVALMTIEGSEDDIAAPGQTYAAHAACCQLPDDRRWHLTVPDCGHFALIHGRRCRNDVLPAIERFIAVFGCGPR